tara:strand:+ start:125 stop:619 length:495 start_codon:yes stop_codon:yes gene_type:complete
MNIFALDICPVKSAELQHDKHVVKMILESAQMLCTAYHEHNIENVPYKKTHHNHPCSVWVRKDMYNFYWLVDHALALCQEYKYRYKKIHKSKAVIDWCQDNSDKLKNFIPMTCITPFAQAMPDEYKNKNSIVLAYRNYYISTKLNNNPKWTNRQTPNIFKTHIN